MPLYHAIVLGVVQGLTEFLPVSSTAHLWLFPWLLGWTDPGLTFDVALHVGTLIAVIIYFFRTWIDILLLGFGLERPLTFVGGAPDRSDGPAGLATRSSTPADSDRPDLRQNPMLLWFLIIGTIPGAVMGWKFEAQADTTWRQPLVIGSAFIIVGILMAVGERVSRGTKSLARVGLADSIVVGVAQAFALVPGVSRSGSTMTAGLFQNMTRRAAARFSFLLSTPIIAGAAFKAILELHHTGIGPGMAEPFVVGVLVSAIVGYATIAYFLRFLQFGTFKIFVYYRVVLGIIVIALAFYNGA